MCFDDPREDVKTTTINELEGTLNDSSWQGDPNITLVPYVDNLAEAALFMDGLVRRNGSNVFINMSFSVFINPIVGRIIEQVPFNKTIENQLIERWIVQSLSPLLSSLSPQIKLRKLRPSLSLASNNWDGRKAKEAVRAAAEVAN